MKLKNTVTAVICAIFSIVAAVGFLAMPASAYLYATAMTIEDRDQAMVVFICGAVAFVIGLILASLAWHAGDE
jgi:hypothetical protein